MSEKTEGRKDGDGGLTFILGITAFVLLSFFALPAAVLMLGCVKLAKERRVLVGGLALIGLALFVLVYVEPFKAEFKALDRHRRMEAWSYTWDHMLAFWGFTWPLAPAAAIVWDVVRPKSIQEQLDEAEQAQAAKIAAQERKLWKGAEKALNKGVDTAALGAIVSMGTEPADFERKGQKLYLRTGASSANLHGLVLGGSGAGKTETLKRLAAIFASQTDYDIFFIDPKPTDELKFYFAGLMAEYGRTCKMYPDSPFNGFRGDARSVHNRLLTIPVLGTEGASAYYAELTEEYVWLGMNAGDGLPRTFDEVAQRLDYDYLLQYYANDPASLQSIQRIKRQDANSVVMRFNNVARKFSTISGAGWAFEDVRAAYFGLPVLEASRDVDAIARFLIEDLKHYFATRKQRNRRTVVFFDEFSAFGSENVVNLMELVRSHGGIVILASQTTAALGDDRLQKRILGNVTIYLQRMNDPREVAALGGMQPVLDVSRHMDTKPNPNGIARYVDKSVIDPTKVAQLPLGGAYIINRGRVAHIKVQQAPALDWNKISSTHLDLALQWMSANNPNAPVLVRRASPAVAHAAAAARPIVPARTEPTPALAHGAPTQAATPSNAPSQSDGADDFI